MSLFKSEKPKKAVRVARVENLNPDKGITVSYMVSEDQKEHKVVLCLSDRTIKTTFKNGFSAYDQLVKYRQLYKQKTVK